MGLAFKTILRGTGVGLALGALVTCSGAWAMDFEGLFGAGPDFPVGSFAGMQGRGFNFSWTNGNRLSSFLSLLGEAEAHYFGGKGSPYLLDDNTFGIIQVAVLLKLRLLDDGFTPYVFGGPGVSYNVSLDSASEGSPFAFLLEAGGGVEMSVDPGTALYVQAKYCVNYVSNELDPTPPAAYIPVQAGIVYFYH